LQLLAEAQSLTTVRLQVFLTNRPEILIRYNIYHNIKAKHQAFILYNIPLTIINHNISLFLEYNIRTIRQECTLGTDWPGEDVLRQLVLHACSLFIWAATACRFIRAGKRFARKRLETVLNSSNSAIIVLEKHFDEIYFTILKHSISSDYSEEEKEQIYNILKHTLRSIAMLLSPLSTSLLTRLL